MPTKYLTTRIITWLVGTVIGLGVVIVPAAFYFLSFQYTCGSLEAEAEINGRIVNEIINANPTMWEYETVRLQEYLSRRPRQKYPETRRIFNIQGQVVVESVDNLVSPIVSRSFELFDSGIMVGRIEISRSLRPLLLESGWIFLLTALIGSAVFVVLRILPIRMIQLSEKSLRESEETYRTLIDTSSDAILVASADTNKVFLLNRQAQELLDLPEAQIMNRQLEDLLDFVDPETMKGIKIFGDVGMETSQSRELSMVRHDGRKITVEVGMSIAEMRGRKILQCILRDVSFRKEAEMRNRALQERLEKAQRMESLGLLAGGVAHDLNNMLGPLVGYPELILLKLPPDSPVRKNVSRIAIAAQEAADVIQDLLMLARRGRYEMQSTNLNDVIQAYLDSPGLLKLVGERPGIIVDLHLAPELAPIYGSSPHLSKAIMNLVVNAFDAIENEGTITIGTRQQSQVKLVRGHEEIKQGKFIAVRVSDTGVGIDPKDIDKIFEPYFSRKKMGRSGSGLGLSVVYGIVKDHKGYYDVISEKGKGTEFTLYFPVTEESKQRSDEFLRDNRGQEKVLIVDDSEAQLELAEELLTSLGYKIATSRNGREAVDYLRRQHADIVVLDMVMENDFDGLDTYREILSIHPGQRAVIASGYSATERVVEMQKLGAGEYVKKPYTRETLGRAVRMELDRQRSETVCQS